MLTHWLSTFNGRVKLASLASSQFFVGWVQPTGRKPVAVGGLHPPYSEMPRVAVEERSDSTELDAGQAPVAWGILPQPPM